MEEKVLNCLLCNSPANNFWLHFYECHNCHLIFKNPSLHLDPAQEKERYLKHQNHSYDPEYRNFLNKLASPMLKLLKPGMKGLDFGCGDTNLMSKIFEENNYSCNYFDPYFFPDESVLNLNYDFVTCSEVVEHFKDPQDTFSLLRQIINPNGFLGIMTELVPNDFQNWWYHRDPTHIIFFSNKTFEWLASAHGYEIILHNPRVIILKKLQAQRILV